MIITLEEADGQPRLDSVSDKKVPLDILLPEQPCRCCSTFPSESDISTQYCILLLPTQISQTIRPILSSAISIMVMSTVFLRALMLGAS